MNIRHILDRINEGDYDFFLSMTDEECKELAPYVLSLWLRGANKFRAEHTIMTDLYLNTKLFTLSRHPRLLYCLAVAANCDMGHCTYSFNNDKKEAKAKEVKLVKRHLKCTTDTATLYLNFLDANDIKALEKLYEEVDK